MIKYLELALSQEVYEYLEELDEMNWSARGNVLNQYLRNTLIGTTVINYYSSSARAAFPLGRKFPSRRKFGRKNNGNTCLPNENKQKTIITCNKLNRTMLKDIYLFFLIIFFLIMFFLIIFIFTSED